ncbi:MAG: methyl-accepting chemotaxis protein [Candidatus Kapaibacteriota bacterium]
MNALAEFIRRQVPEALLADKEEARKARLIITFLVYAVIFAGAYAPLTYFQSKNPQGAVAILIGGLQAALTITLLRQTASVQAAGHSLAFLFAWLMGYLSWTTGGSFASSLLWMPSGILSAFFFIGRKGGIGWTIVMALNSVTLGLVEMNGIQLPMLTDPSQKYITAINSALGAFALIAMFASFFESSKNQALQEVEKARNEAEEQKQQVELALASIADEKERAQAAEERATMMQQSLQANVEEMLVGIHRFAEGDLTVVIAKTYQQQILNKLTQDINTTIQKMNNLVGQVQETVARTGEIAEHVSTAAHQIASTADDQAQQTTLVADSVGAMVHALSRGVEKTSNVERLAGESGKAAENGAMITGNTVQKMREIARVVGEAAGVVRGLGNASAEIGEIVQVIEEIADQTNLLALNAAIEAARAGDQGRGFAVVADEVRKLAERTAQATKQIGGTIRHIQHETERAVKEIERGASEAEAGLQLAQTTGSALQEIVASAGNVAHLIQEVVQSSTEQASTGKGISDGVEHMSASVEETAASIGEIARSTEQLHNVVQHLQHLVGSFTIEPTNSHQIKKSDGRKAISLVTSSLAKTHSSLEKPLFENRYVVVFLSSSGSKKVLEVLWTPATDRMSNQEFKQALQRFGELTIEHKTQGIFVDVRENRHVLTPELQQWHDDNIVPLYSKGGVRKMAFLAPPSSLTRASSEAAFEAEKAKELLQVQFFEDGDIAWSWLLHS